jgi:hypothetical protein
MDEAIGNAGLGGAVDSCETEAEDSPVSSQVNVMICMSTIHKTQNKKISPYYSQFEINSYPLIVTCLMLL